MPDTTDERRESRSVDFFISRAGAQATIAKWIGNFLEEAGHSIILQDWDFHDKNFLERMHDALKRASRVILLLSPEYLVSPYCTAEWTNAMAGDPLNTHGRIVFFRVKECAPDGLLKGMAYLDLVNLFKEGNDKLLREIVLAALKPGRSRSGPQEGFWRSSKPILHTKIRPPPNFTGRRSDLDALDRVLTPRSSEQERALPPRAAIHGLPGAGKSALAIQYAWDNQNRFAGIWWIPAATTEDIARGLVNLGSQFLPGVKDMQDRELAVATTLRLLASGGFDKPWLLIFDDVETPKALRAYVPPSGAIVVITSRWADWAGEATSFPLGVLPPPDAVEFLLRRTDRSDRAGADRLASVLGHLPLALSHAGAYCKHIGENFNSYAERLPDLIKRAPAGTDYERTVFATFSTACEAAFALCQDASIVMSVIAFLAPNDIPVTLIDEHIMTRDSRDAALEALAMLSLILVRPESESGAVIDVHRLVQAVMLVQIEERGTTAEELRRAYDMLDRRLPHEIWETEAAARSIFAAGETVLQTHFDPNKESVQVLPPDDDNKKYFLVFMRAQRNQAEGERRKTLDGLIGKIFAMGAAADRYGVPVDPDHARAWRRWDRLLSHAAILAVHAFEVLGRGSHTSRLTGAMAAIFYSQGRPYGDVELFLNHSVSDAEAASPPDRPALASSLRNLSYFLAECRRYGEAEPLLAKALSIDVDVLGAEHANSVRDALRLAALLIDLNRPTDARALVKQILTLVKPAFGESAQWPYDVEQAYGAVLTFEFMEGVKKLNAEKSLQIEVAQEFQKIKSTVARQRMLGLALYSSGAIAGVLAIGSILDHYLDHLIQPLRGPIDVYRAAVHGPLERINRFVTPDWRVPGLVWDVFMAWLAFWIAANASLLRLEGKSVIGKIRAMATDFEVSRGKRYLMLTVGPVILFISAPPFFVYFTARRGFPIDPESKGLVIFVVTIASCLVFIFLFNQIVRAFS